MSVLLFNKMNVGFSGVDSVLGLFFTLLMSGGRVLVRTVLLSLGVSSLSTCFNPLVSQYFVHTCFVACFKV